VKGWINVLYLIIKRIIMRDVNRKVKLKMSRSFLCIGEEKEVEAGWVLWRLDRKAVIGEMSEKTLERAEVRRRGREKNAIKGHRYSSCARWTVATWFALSPWSISIENHKGCARGEGVEWSVTENNATIPAYEGPKRN
jgi:hypothetical protein